MLPFLHPLLCCMRRMQFLCILVSLLSYQSHFCHSLSVGSNRWEKWIWLGTKSTAKLGLALAVCEFAAFLCCTPWENKRRVLWVVSCLRQTQEMLVKILKPGNCPGLLQWQMHGIKSELQDPLIQKTFHHSLASWRIMLINDSRNSHKGCWRSI